jgi:hypothetical protein
LKAKKKVYFTVTENSIDENNLFLLSMNKYPLSAFLVLVYRNKSDSKGKITRNFLFEIFFFISKVEKLSKVFEEKISC